MAQQPLSRKEREYLVRRSEILRVALKLFAEKGFHGTSIQMIAEKSEFAVGTLYHFFPHKEDIYKAIIQETAEKFHAALTTALEIPGGVIEKLRACLEVKIKVFLDNLDHVRIFFAETQGASFSVKTGLDAELKAQYEDYIQRLTGVFRSGIREKTFRKLDPYLLAVALDSLSTAFLVEHLDHPEAHPFDTETILNLFLNGVAAKRGSGK
ncbi:MAG: TetR/AcrR family transcriptional regulator [Deltaproteobacteria bacterium]|nr:TetR/AcrR family transcriptional regulator [Deltaproteobacteria bacterium]